MDKKILTKHLVWLMFFVFVLNSLAMKFYWYSSIWWLDMPMHFLGGFWVGLFFIWFFADQKAQRIILFVLIIGVSWEFFEFFSYNYIGRDYFNVLDTLSDIFFDLAGGTFAILYLLKRVMPKPANTI